MVKIITNWHIDANTLFYIDRKDGYMNQFLNKLEKKFGRYAVPDLIRYVMALYCLGAVLGFVDAIRGTNVAGTIYHSYLSLNMDAVFHGQIWRLFTYLIEPYGFSSGMGMLVNILFFLIQVNLFLLFGRSLEQAWGTFRFNMYFLSGYLLNIIAALILYLSPLHSTFYEAGFTYIYWSMFFAFALLNPNMEFLLYFIIPIKVKWLAILDAVLLGYSVLTNLKNGFLLLGSGHIVYANVYFSVAIAILVALGNFLIFFFATRNYKKISPREIHRRKEFKRRAAPVSGARHRCAVCGRTELDDENLEFRFCSKCDGNFEYCSDHLFTHQHVRNQNNKL